MYSRRTAILGGLTLLTGCQALGSSGDGDESCEYAAVADPFDPAVDLPPDYSRFQRTLAERTIKRGDARAVFGPRPLLDTSFVPLDGSYYRIDLAEHPLIELPTLVLSVTWESGQTPTSEAPVVNFAELPVVDQRALRAAVHGGLYSAQVHPQSVLDVSSSPFPYPEGTDDSTLADRERLSVRWEGRVYDVTIHRRDVRERRVWDYVAERIADDATSFRTWIDERYVVVLDDLSAGEREIVTAAIDGGYERQTETPDPAWDRLVSRLGERALPAAHYEWYVAFDGARYRLQLDSYEQCRY